MGFNGSDVRKPNTAMLAIFFSSFRYLKVTSQLFRYAKIKFFFPMRANLSYLKKTKGRFNHLSQENDLFSRDHRIIMNSEMKV